MFSWAVLVGVGPYASRDPDRRFFSEKKTQRPKLLQALRPGNEDKLPDPQLRLRILVGRNIAVGPGKADLLEAILTTNSIAAASRQMGMSYKRAWLLIDTMNCCFAKSAVAAKKGGNRGGGAGLTALGEEVLVPYRRMQSTTRRATTEDLRALKGEMTRGALNVTATQNRLDVSALGH
jgi:molybdate transport system regulatory protein